MNKLKVCRLCLVSDVKLYNLRNHPLEEHLEPIIGMNPITMGAQYNKVYACFECFAMIKKFYNFREKCIIGQATLCNMIFYENEVTAKDIKSIDRSGLRLTSNLTQCFIPEDSIINITHEELKQEDLKPIQMDQCDIKVELPEDAEVDHDLPDSSDEEPLSMQWKKKNEKKKEKRVCRRRKKDKDVESDEFDVKVESEAESSDIPEPSKQQKDRTEVSGHKKRGPKKSVGLTPDEIAMEEYVTIIKLTVEQQIAEIEARKQSTNYVNAPLKCDICFKGFIEEQTYKNHMDKHDASVGPEECVVCKIRFSSRRLMQKHSTIHEKKYSCKSCEYISRTATQAKQHQKWHKGVTYKCQYCDETSNKWTSFLSHVRIKHPSEFICCACGYSYVSRLGLTMHKSMMHKELLPDSVTGPYCDLCAVQFVNEEAYKRHLVTSTKHNYGNGCRVCGSSFSTAEELRLHHRKLHAKKRPRNYGKRPSNVEWPNKCELCDVMICSAREHWAHYRKAHPNGSYPVHKAYICEICGKGFRGNAFLEYHKRTHSSVREYSCEECHKSFYNRSNLLLHQKSHSDHRPHVCQLCGKGFKSKGALDRHFRCHTGIKPYKCEFCGKSFGQSNSCKLHVRTVHLKLPAPYLSKARLQRRRETTSAAIQYTADAVIPTN